ncbi:hypothetical protein JCM15457_1666 [Liquorilactobacillus sucicola DSM 21376 = JCM 15457]|uniref:Ester cyclase n=1 Tax=Liquorilactobacillus sucicola DSM 21376 = JCM 15457 TaxID=1423806 RepID=A0A023CZ14_9LACO|nr:ester cyclase [Liquorilactobacillus sucicola]KRN07641.1 hypothetical protein FD15_GL000934 [Liquorilactobacillus sucicola DSM 21376 = JCM 15457]GAJ26725.1 hypothetical protein JCM15457_1666 [Liquorilactobacillus sucicola DSM 21376 = JCM 15457]
MSKKELITQFYEPFNNGDVTVYNRLLSPNWINHPADVGKSPDLTGFKEGVLELRESFNDFKLEILSLTEQDKRVVAHIKMSGVHTKKFAGILPSHHFVTFYGLDLHQVGTEHILATWHFEDLKPLQ